jgi:hypothetical protein
LALLLNAVGRDNDTEALDATLLVAVNGSHDPVNSVKVLPSVE